MGGCKIKLCACGVVKKTCALHSPINFCPCGTLISQCRKCRQHRGVCGCGKPRGLCREHGGYLLCPCGSGHHKSRCTKCGSGGKLCKHRKRVNNCMQCLRESKAAGTQCEYMSPTGEVCPCAKPRKFCSVHGGSHLCVSCRLITTKLKSTECSTCRRFRCGAAPRKGHEHAVKTFLDACIAEGSLPHYSSHDKIVAPGLDPVLYGSNRPDFLWRLPDRWIILEVTPPPPPPPPPPALPPPALAPPLRANCGCARTTPVSNTTITTQQVDEAQHKGKTYSCERRRELELCNCAGFLPVVFVRLNPDAFSTGSKSSRVRVALESTQRRHAAVLRNLQAAVRVPEPTGLTFVRLFFDCECKAAPGSSHRCGFEHVATYVDHEAFLMRFQV